MRSRSADIARRSLGREQQPAGPDAEPGGERGEGEKERVPRQTGFLHYPPDMRQGQQAKQRASGDHVAFHAETSTQPFATVIGRSLTASRTAYFASKRVESRAGRGELASVTISGIS